MQKKPTFNPEITRVELNPEQAVLSCECWDDGSRETDLTTSGTYVCVTGSRSKFYTSNMTGNQIGS